MTSDRYPSCLVAKKATTNEEFLDAAQERDYANKTNDMHFRAVCGERCSDIFFCTPALSQASPADDQWAGSIQCQLDVQGQGYSRHEVQTWTLSGGVPSGQGTLRQYPATWSVSGSGSVQRMQGAQSSTVKWSINIPPMNAPLAIFVRNSDNNLVIKQATPPRFIANGISGTRQVTINGVPQPAGQVGHPVREWNFGWIVAPSASTNVSDSSSVDTDGLPAEIMQPAGFPPSGELQVAIYQGRYIARSHTGFSKLLAG